MNKSKSCLIVITLSLLILFNPAQVKAWWVSNIPLNFAVKFALFAKNSINAIKIWDIKDGEVVINKEGQDLIKEAKYASKLKESLQAFQNTEEQNFYKSFYARQAALENKDSSAWKALRSGEELGMSAYETGAGLGTMPEDLKGVAKPSLLGKAILKIKDLYGAMKTILGSNKDKNEAGEQPAQISKSISGGYE